MSVKDHDAWRLSRVAAHLLSPREAQYDPTYRNQPSTASLSFFFQVISGYSFGRSFVINISSGSVLVPSSWTPHTESLVGGRCLRFPHTSLGIRMMLRSSGFPPDGDLMMWKI
ncbi:hypothetical protein RRG08_037761 [Elysia crispata]|uniref:Uncharacterized protein n=1 Tax=Elysia crispata TaxID=231223 RepID=A0AAE1A7I1_9GAST|nr:hypothetical protein RRG08_037761 [Elysia crispata]